MNTPHTGLPRSHSMRRLLRFLLALAVLLAFATPAMASTYFVRTDGGDTRQCTGLSDSAYPGRGSSQPCAWKHPFHALPPDSKPRIAGGDTLIIGPGDYMIGYGASGSEDTCSSDWPWDCHMSAIPSGPSANQPTRLVGKTDNGKCLLPPTLWGTDRVDLMLNLEGSSNVEVGCLDITDRSDCVEHHANPKVRCERDKSPYGQWGSVGVYASASRNVLLHDLDIHGLAHTGIAAGGLRDWTLERVKINRNGWVGWDGDIGDDSSNSGAIVMRDVEIAWNGCGELWKTGKVHACWAQESGGYGDGIGTAKTGGKWLFERVRVHHNTSDGIDLLYLDGNTESSAILRQVYAVGNAGNQIKVRGNAIIENSLVVGQCGYFNGYYDMVEGEHCRAQGNAISLIMSPGSNALVRHNTITGEGDCLILSEDGSSRERIDIQNNVLIGQREFLSDDGELTCGHYAHESQATVVFTRNLFWNVKHGQCPAGSLCDRDPRLTSSVMGNFNAMPLPGSPLIDSAKGPGPSQDFYGKPRPSGLGPDIGAVELQKK